MMPLPHRRRAPLAILSAFLAGVVLVLAGALLLVVRANDQHTASVQATVVVLRTEIAQQQHSIEHLQSIVGEAKTPIYQADGQHSYVAAFQIDKYSYVLYLQWVESNGFIHDGQLLTTDNYVRKGSRSFQFSGIDNNGRFGFTGSDKRVTMTFSGTTNSNGTFTVIGLPWYVFYGFVGGTFTQTLHPGTLQDYNADVANLANPPQ